MKARFRTEQRQKLGLYKLGDSLHFPGHQENTTKTWKCHARGPTWHSCTARNVEGHAGISAQSRGSPHRGHDLQAQPYPGYHPQLSPHCPSPQCVSDPPTLPGSPWFYISLVPAAPPPAFQIPSPQRFLQAPCTPNISLQAPTKYQVFSKVKFISSQRSQFTSTHILQLSFMSLPSCSSKQPLLVVFYFGGAHLAATFCISPQNCTHLISQVSLLTVCRSSKQQHFCVVHEHFRTSAGHCWGSCIRTTGP